MSDKKLTIGSAFDDIGIKKAVKALQNLRKEATDTQKTFKGMGVGNQKGVGAFAKTFVDGGEKLRKFRGVSEDTARSMKTILGKQIQEGEERVKKYTARVEKMTQAYVKHQRVMSNPNSFNEFGFDSKMRNRDFHEQRGKRLQRGLIGETGKLFDSQDDLKSLVKDPGMIGAVLKAMGLVAGVALVGSQIAGLYQGNKTVGINNLGTMGGIVGGQAGNFMSNPVAAGSAVNGKFMMPDGSIRTTKEIVDKAGGKAAIAINDVLGFKFHNVYDDIVNGRLDVAAAQKQNEALSSAQASNPLAGLLDGELGATAGIRMAAARRLGGRANSVGLAWMGAGMGADPGTSMSLGMSLAEKYGGRDVVGNNGYAAQALRMQGVGLDANFTGDFLGRMGSAGGNGGETLQRLLAEGVRVGMSNLDVQFFEKIGGAVAGAAITRGGAMSSGGSQDLAAALMGGISNGGSAAGMHAADVRMQGISGINKLDRIPAVHFTKMGIAKRILGDGASGAQIMALAQATPEELIGGSRRMDALGLGNMNAYGMPLSNEGAAKNKGNRLQILRGGIEAALTGLTGNGHSQEATRLRSMMGGGIEKAMRNPQFVQLAGALLSTSTTLSQEEAEGAFGLSAHAGDKLGGRGGLNRVGDGIAEMKMILDASNMMKLVGKESQRTADALLAAAASFRAVTQEIENINVGTGKRMMDRIPLRQPTEGKSKAAPVHLAPLDLSKH